MSNIVQNQHFHAYVARGSIGPTVEMDLVKTSYERDNRSLNGGKFQFLTKTPPFGMRVSICIQGSHWNNSTDKGAVPEVGTRQWLETGFSWEKKIQLALKTEEVSESDKKVEEEVQKVLGRILEGSGFYRKTNPVLHADVIVRKEWVYNPFSLPSIEEEKEIPHR